MYTSNSLVLSNEEQTSAKAMQQLLLSLENPKNMILNRLKTYFLHTETKNSMSGYSRMHNRHNRS